MSYLVVDYEILIWMVCLYPLRLRRLPGWVCPPRRRELFSFTNGTILYQWLSAMQVTAVDLSTKNQRHLWILQVTAVSFRLLFRAFLVNII